jgi:hypothetical protein
VLRARNGAVGREERDAFERFVGRYRSEVEEGVRVPEVGDLVAAGGGDAGAVFREGERGDGREVGAKRGEAGVRAEVPGADLAVV